MKGEWIRKPTNGTTVLFIHGILSSGETAWRHDNGTYWPKLVEDDLELKGVGVYVFTYYTGIFSGNYDLNDAVDALKEHMRLDNVFECTRLVFVCHSMGGIVARKLVVERENDLIENGIETGLFLLGSPSLGSRYANWLVPLAKALGHTQADALRFSQGNSWLNSLDKEFQNLKESGRLRITGKELVEDRFVLLKRLWKKQIVEPFSGARYFGERVKVPLSDHFTIAKPDNDTAFQHRLLRKFVMPPTRPGRNTRAMEAPRNAERDAIEDGLQGLRSLRLLKVLQKTRHSAIFKCRHGQSTVVLKKTAAQLCDEEALNAAVRLGSDIPGSSLAAPRRCWVKSDYLWELHDYHDGLTLGDLVHRLNDATEYSGLSYHPLLRECFEVVHVILKRLAKENLVHRDITPYNLSLTCSGEIKLIDWSFCCFGNTSQAPVGTPGFIAPEQRLGEAVPESDWYSLAATLRFLAGPTEDPDFEDAIEYASKDGTYLAGMKSLCRDLGKADPSDRHFPRNFWFKRVSKLVGMGLHVWWITQLQNGHLILHSNGVHTLPTDIEQLERQVNNDSINPPEARNEIARLVREYRASME